MSSTLRCSNFSRNGAKGLFLVKIKAGLRFNEPTRGLTTQKLTIATPVILTPTLATTLVLDLTVILKESDLRGNEALCTRDQVQGHGYENRGFCTVLIRVAPRQLKLYAPVISFVASRVARCFCGRVQVQVQVQVMDSARGCE